MILECPEWIPTLRKVVSALDVIHAGACADGVQNWKKQHPSVPIQTSVVAAFAYAKNDAEAIAYLEKAAGIYGYGYGYGYGSGSGYGYGYGSGLDGDGDGYGSGDGYGYGYGSGYGDGDGYGYGDGDGYGYGSGSGDG